MRSKLRDKARSGPKKFHGTKLRFSASRQTAADNYRARKEIAKECHRLVSLPRPPPHRQTTTLAKMRRSRCFFFLCTAEKQGVWKLGPLKTNNGFIIAERSSQPRAIIQGYCVRQTTRWFNPATGARRCTITDEKRDLRVASRSRMLELGDRTLPRVESRESRVESREWRSDDRTIGWINWHYEHVGGLIVSWHEFAQIPNNWAACASLAISLLGVFVPRTSSLDPGDSHSW
jgi:hypothetical protein